MYHRVTQDGKILTAIRKYFALSLSLFAILFCLRVFDIISSSTLSSIPPGSWKIHLSGLRFDLAISIQLLAYFMFPFLIVAYFSLKASTYVFMAFNMIVALISISLLQYFQKALVPLGSDLWGYTMSEIKLTVGSSGAMSLKSMLPLLVFIGISVYFSLFLFRFEFKRTYSFLFCLFLSIILMIDLPLTPAISKSKTEFQRSIQTNKLGFFLASNLEYFQKKRQREKELMDASADVSGGAVNTTGLSAEFPFLRQDVTKDVLSQYFKFNKEKPNFVFILVESLGRSYSGENAELGSFTPFLDGLMAKGLYWENNLSTSGRTFSVMPSVFGSLPFGENGFAEMGTYMPKQLSLISILMKNGYTSTFLYGSDRKFDNMSLFFEKQGTKNFIDQEVFGPKYTKLPSEKGGFTWGYGDLDLFKKYFEVRETIKDKEPRIDIMLTINMHSPFLLGPQAEYDAKFKTHLNNLKLKEEKKKYVSQYGTQLATVLYFDDALNYFFKEFAKREDFKNTIFIITGDHRMPEIPISSQLDRFHVPLLIYSPMLKETQKFSSISSHYDITPSILAMMKASFKIKSPSVVTWIGTGLDINPQFRNIHKYPLMRNKTELVDYIDGEYFLSNGTLYKVFPNNLIDIVPDVNKKKELEVKFELYKKNNWYVCKKDKLIPDSLNTTYK